MPDFLATDDGDLDVSSGIQVATGIDECRQRLDYALTLNLGEWFADISAGLPYLKNSEADDLDDMDSQVQWFECVKRTNPEVVALAIVDYVEDLSFIDKVISSSSSYNDKTRELSITMVLRYVDGTEITYSRYI